MPVVTATHALILRKKGHPNKNIPDLHSLALKPQPSEGVSGGARGARAPSIIRDFTNENH